MKNNVRKFSVSGGIYIGLAVLFGIVFIALRTIQLKFYTNFNTGFYNGPDELTIALFGLAVVFFIGVFVLVMADRNQYCAEFGHKGKRSVQAASFILAAFSVVYFSVMLVQSIQSQRSNPALLFADGLFGILMVFGFVYLPFRLEKSEGSAADILLCCPCLWACSKLFLMFFDHMMVATIYENLLNILRVAALCVFLFNMARVCAGIEQKNTRRWMILFGLTTVVLGLCTTVSQYLVLLIPLLTNQGLGSTYSSDHIMAATPMDFMITVFSFIFLIAYLSCCRVKTENGSHEPKRASCI